MVKIVKSREDYSKTRCAICWHALRPKSPLLCGMKCIKFEIKEKLKFLLPPQDFSTLYDETVFTNPRICNMCFVTVKKIPRTIAKLQGLVGKKINTRLYKPQRQEWNSGYIEPNLASDQRKLLSSSQQEPSVENRKPSSGATNTVTPAEDNNALLLGKKGSPHPLTEIAGENDNDDPLEDSQDNVYVGQGEVESETSYFAQLREDGQVNESNCGLKLEVKEEHSDTQKQETVLSLAQRKITRKKTVTHSFVDGQIQGKVKLEKERGAKAKLEKATKKKTVSPVTSRKEKGKYQLRSHKESKIKTFKSQRTNKSSKQSRVEAKNVVVQKERRTRSVALRSAVNTRKGKQQLFEDQEHSDSDVLSDIPLSDSEDEYVPPTKKTKAADSSSNDSEDCDIVEDVKKIGSKPSTRKNLQKASLKGKKQSKPLTVKFAKLKPKKTKAIQSERVKEKKTGHILNEENGENTKVKKTSLKVDIPVHLSEHSKSKLKDLATKVMDYIDGRQGNMPERMMIKCSVDECDHSYPLWHHMAVHVKYYHHNGELPENDNYMQKMSMLADLGGPNPETYQFKCRHEGCNLAFTCEENFQEHKSQHGTDLVLMCGFPDCTKAFKLVRSLHVHFRSHTGERPFICNITGCEKSFKDSKDLTKHRSRHTGEKPHRCTSEGCDKTFFTVSELNSHKTTHVKSDTLCCDVCGKQYANDKGLLRHKRRIHGIGKPGRHKCPYDGCEESFVKKEKLEIHLCTHSPERRLFCEKCGKKFSCQRYLDVHYKIHIKNEKHAADPPSRTVECEYPGCGKMFTTRENMKSHVLNQHRGRKPRAIPGVFFPCMVEGCGKQFSFRSTLYRHNKLVHKGGDYKLGREVVKYACKYEGCAEEFNRKNLLEEHMVMEHGKTPKRLLPLQNKELDFIERICGHCGMVLTVSQLARHEEVYHSEQAIREMKENSPYPCHLKGCDQVFNTREDRKAHVQEHIENPPYKCGVGDCEEIFYLEKNLDNHLWKHSKRVSICDYEGCSQKFDDQLQLAKHSRVHYHNKMKCPWPNCDNWLTETGHLKPHFIAHSRSLRANFDSDFVCEICELAFNSKWGLMIHKRMHGEEAAAKPSLSKLAKFACEEDGCQATFVDHKGFFDHFLYHYTNSPASCDFKGCTESFRNMITMSRHTKCHYNGKFRCPWQGCAKLFASVFIVKKHLYRHILSNSFVAASRPYSCSQCFMVFKSESNLASHQEHHNEKSDYVCPTCGKKGRHNHIKTQRPGNKSRKPQECQQCGASYATISGLKFHLLQKHKIGKWPFKCSFCGKGFVSSREMQRHIPSHTKEKPFTCDICGASFASHTGHRAHMRKHAGQKYVCDVEGCGKVYTTPISLRGHKAQHAGFSKTCHYCFKTYKNPYGHKCKASRDSKKKMNEPAGQAQAPRPPPPPSLPATALLAPPPPQPSAPTLTTLVPVTTSNTMQHTVIMPQQIVTHNMEIQQAGRTIMAPNTLSHTHVMPHNLAQGLPQGLPQSIPQSLQHNLPNQGMMQERNGQLGPMDMTRGNPMDITRGNPMDMGGDYTFNNINNYVVFWDSQNIS